MSTQGETDWGQWLRDGRALLASFGILSESEFSEVRLTFSLEGVMLTAIAD